MWSLPRSYAVGTWVLSPVTKRPEHEIDQAPICTAVVKNEWSFTSPFPIRLHGVNKDNLSTVAIITFILLKYARKCLTSRFAEELWTALATKV